MPALRKTAHCPDCGNAPVNHFIEKANAVVGKSGEIIFLHSFVTSIRDSHIHRISRDFLRTIAPSFLKFLAATGLATVVHEPDDKTGGRARSIWLEAARRGIPMREFRPFGVSSEIFVAEIPSTDRPSTIVFQGLPRPAVALSGKNGPPASLAWVDNKPVLKEKLAATGIPVARGDTAFAWKKAREIFKQLKQSEKPGRDVSVVVKPSTGSRSRHTTAHVGDEKSLRDAYVKAKRLSPTVIVEEELAGHVYRGTVIGGRVVGIRRKDPPQVTGDGLHSARELIDIENRRPERQGPIYSNIKIGDENFGLKKDLSLDTVPKRGDIVILSDKTAIGLGGGSIDVTDIAHPDIIALLEKIAVILDDHLVGADFILTDIARPLSEQPHSGVIECNSLPFIDVHLFPLNGKSRDTPAALWDAVTGQISIGEY